MVTDSASSELPRIAYSCEMGLTHDDFWRLLPKAMGNHPYTVKDNTIYAEIGSGTLEIMIGPPQERRIALLRLPYARVSFAFEGVSESEQLAFKRHFDRRYQRGGG